MKVQAKNLVTDVPAAGPESALAHFESRFTRETDCWDVHAALELDEPGFVLLDVRSREGFESGHVKGALNIPHWQLTAKRLEAYSPETLFVVYCAGPHCNGAARGAIRLARLGRPVKEMIGGATGWVDEGFTLVRGPEQGS
ncbi:rhodanese [Acidobacteria bacterium Mor1]|nr:rhodanese [Acidobacteria bacterium Mor1]